MFYFSNKPYNFHSKYYVFLFGVRYTSEKNVWHIKGQIGEKITLTIPPHYYFHFILREKEMSF